MSNLAIEAIAYRPTTRLEIPQNRRSSSPRLRVREAKDGKKGLRKAGMGEKGRKRARRKKPVVGL